MKKWIVVQYLIERKTQFCIIKQAVGRNLKIKIHLSETGG